MLNIEELANRNELFDKHYKLIRPLSTDGGTADVWLAIDVNTIDVQLDSEEQTKSSDETGMLVAIKIYRPKNALDVEGEQRFRDEFKMVYECRHENLLQPTAFSIFEETPYLVLPYCKYGSSEQLIGKKLSADEIWKFILDVSSGLNRLHTNEIPIIHQDIKPANVLIDNNKDYAITDFGISSKMGGVHGYYYDDGNSGTLAYMAPERFQEYAEPIAQSDIWALGATLCEIITGKVPFGEEGGMNQVTQNMPMPVIENVPSDIQRLIHACLSKEPGDRPSAAQIRDAALAKQYPIKKKNYLYITIGVIAVILLSLILTFGSKSGDDVVVPRTESELYDMALCKLNSNDVDSVKEGLLLMDSLSKLEYIPAIFEIAITYGWYKDSLSLKRKKILGIDVFSEEGEGGCLPKLDKYSSEAVSRFLKIIDFNDSSYAHINALSAYRLACYYVMPNPIFKQDTAKGRQFLEISKDWVLQTNDTILLNKINKSLRSFYEEIN